MAIRIQYYPPNISRDWLITEVIHRYPNHQKSRNLIAMLVDEYLRLWRLSLSFSERRIVAPGPIIAVQQVHRTHREEYLHDCMEYFRRFMGQELIWGGRLDVRGTVDTVTSYSDLYNESPPGPWNDMTEVYNLGRPTLRLV